MPNYKRSRLVIGLDCGEQPPRRHRKCQLKADFLGRPFKYQPVHVSYRFHSWRTRPCYIMNLTRWNLRHGWIQRQARSLNNVFAMSFRSNITNKKYSLVVKVTGSSFQEVWQQHHQWPRQLDTTTLAVSVCIHACKVNDVGGCVGSTICKLKHYVVVIRASHFGSNLILLSVKTTKFQIYTLQIINI